MQSVTKRVVAYAVGKYLTATGSHQNAFDTINFGIDKTLPEALGALPEEMQKGYDLSTVKQKETFRDGVMDTHRRSRATASSPAPPA
jgi:hypothetical protein